MTGELVLRGHAVVTPDGVRPAALVIDGGIIQDVVGYGQVAPQARVVEVDDGVVAPGLVDSHVHINEPGRTEWEGFATATRAAIAGGVTTVVDMPLNSLPPTVTAEALESKRSAARGQVFCDVAFWGGAVPGSTAALAGLRDAGARGFKCFLTDSGVEEFAPLASDELDRVVREVAGLGLPLLVHAEAPAAIEAAGERVAGADPRRYRTWLESRPAQAEHDAITDLVARSAATGCRVHVLHLSSAGALATLREARARGLPVSAETCPHYLALAAEDIPDGATPFKCAPPIRQRANREGLWRGLAEGVVDAVVSDHSPCPPDLKLLAEGDYVRAWGGISSLQLGLAVVWTAARARRHGVADVARWMSAAPARVAGLAGKGLLAPGYDADLVVWDPEASFVVDPGDLEHRHPVTPYSGQRLRGVVRRTYLRGVEVYTAGEPIGAPAGRVG